MGIIWQSILTEGELSPLQIDLFKGWEKDQTRMVAWSVSLQELGMLIITIMIII